MEDMQTSWVFSLSGHKNHIFEAETFAKETNLNFEGF